MFQSESLFHISPSWKQYSWNPQQNFLNINEIINRQEYPWICPEPGCNQRFKWDTQLLRHQRKTKHQNPNRKERQQKRYQKKQTKFVKCNLCLSLFQDSIERVKHMRWCPNDPRTQKLRNYYKSSFSEYPYQCYHHEIPWYFSTLEKLQQHLKDHKNKELPKKKLGTRLSCNNCGSIQRSYAKLEQHQGKCLRNQLRHQKQFGDKECQNCGKKFRDNWGLKRHQKQVKCKA